MRSSSLTANSDQLATLSTQWTVNDLREHLSCGELFIAKLASADASSTLGSSGAGVESASGVRVVGNRLLRSVAEKKSPSDNAASSPSPPLVNGVSNRVRAANVITTAHPLLRQLRARLHTAIGQVSQIMVTVESLVLMLADAVQIMQ